jgi:hypothetical protein
VDLLEEDAICEIGFLIHEGGNLFEIDGQIVAIFMEYCSLE